MRRDIRLASGTSPAGPRRVGPAGVGWRVRGGRVGGAWVPRRWGVGPRPRSVARGSRGGGVSARDLVPWLYGRFSQGDPAGGDPVVVEVAQVPAARLRSRRDVVVGDLDAVPAKPLEPAAAHPVPLVRGLAGVAAEAVALDPPPDVGPGQVQVGDEVVAVAHPELRHRGGQPDRPHQANRQRLEVVGPNRSPSRSLSIASIRTAPRRPRRGSSWWRRAMASSMCGERRQASSSALATRNGSATAGRSRIVRTIDVAGNPPTTLRSAGRSVRLSCTFHAALFRRCPRS